MKDLFPPIEPNAKGMLKVDGIHTIYWEESGNPNGVPVVFLHGGPGAGSNPTHRRFFDPSAWRIIIFDQRGAGKSTPFAETRNNTTDLLVADMEKLREHLRVEKWHLFGGSWGSTLAIAYAETHPERCLGLILRGICLFRKKELDWFFDGVENFFPEEWRKFSGFISPNGRGDVLAAYHKLFSGPDCAEKSEGLRVWYNYETACSSLLPPDEETIRKSDESSARSAMPIIEAHYFVNNLFEPDSLLLDNLWKIRRVPAVIVQGRYDIVCPISTADELHENWPEAEYRVIPDAGHSTLEPGIRSALIEATEKFKNIAS